MKATIYVANLLPIDAARIAQALDLSGTVHDALGFGAWGVEPTTIIELGDTNVGDLGRLCDAIFAACPDEEALYVMCDGIKSPNVYRWDLPLTIGV